LAIPKENKFGNFKRSAKEIFPTCQNLQKNMSEKNSNMAEKDVQLFRHVGNIAFALPKL